ncbi:unnamed protein product [Orchesella dallaii]|uniref:Lipase n=1 Tax=Orchesella dallaii TaxID=48710 RepID=A0ABP1RN27_9HEXA
MTVKSQVAEIRIRGYNATNYTILSEDGYYSTIYRIPGGPQSPPRKGKRSVLVYHGFGSAAQSWIIQPGSRNLAFTLADAGYEVWLANARGTSPSKKHINLDADRDLEYWNFNIDELGTKDLPLMVDLMLRETGTKQVYYACHSVGCAILLSGLENVPDLNGKFKASFFLAPSVFFGSGYNPALAICRSILGTPLESFFYWVMGGKLNGEPSKLATYLGLTPGRICSWKFMRCGICDNVLFAFYGADPQQLDYGNLPNIVTKLGDNGALKLPFHFTQIDIACDFQKYDFGLEKNMLKYGSSKPPKYNISQMKVPTYIFYGELDNFVTPWDAARTRDAIPKEFMKGFYKVESELFNHIDFLMAKDADVLVYNKVLSIVNEIESK